MGTTYFGGEIYVLEYWRTAVKAMIFGLRYLPDDESNDEHQFFNRKRFDPFYSVYDAIV